MHAWAGRGARAVVEDVGAFVVAMDAEIVSRLVTLSSSRTTITQLFIIAFPRIAASFRTGSKVSVE